MWQMSQPLHLRHLAIIRDAALTDGIPHYIHYSFVNFRKLVDEGKASWESVMTITKEHEDFGTTAAIEAESELDEMGFPKLPENLFQGRHNDAGLVECIKGAGKSRLSLSAADPKAVKLSDGNWGNDGTWVLSHVHMLTSDRLPLRIPCWAGGIPRYV